jgi:PAS domain S-box-containing protein
VSHGFIQAVQTDGPLMQDVLRRVALMVDEETGLRGYLLTHDASFLVPYTTARRTLPALRARDARRGSAVPGVPSLLASMAQRAVAWERWAHHLLAHPPAGPSSSSANVTHQRAGKRLFDAWRVAADHVLHYLDADQNAHLQASLRTVATLNPVLAAIVGGALILLALIGWMTIRVVAQPLDRLRVAAEAIGRGDFSRPVHAEGASEFSLLARSMEQMRRQLHSQYAVAAVIGSTLRLDEIYAEFAARVRDLVPLDRLSLVLVEDDGQTVVTAYTIGVGADCVKPGTRRPLADSVYAQAFQTGSCVLHADLRAPAPDELSAVEQQLLADGIRAEAIVPFAKGGVTGALNLWSTQPGAYTMENLGPIVALAPLVAAAADNARLYGQLEQAAESLRLQMEQRSAVIATQNDIARSELDLSTVLTLIAERAQALTRASGAAIGLVDGDDIDYRAASGTLSSEVGTRLAIAQSLTGWSVQAGETVRCDDTDMDPRVNIETRTRVGARAAIAVPLYDRRRVVGVLNVVSPQAYAFDDTDVQTLQLMAGFIAGALRHAADFEAMRTMITERTAALAALQESEARLRTVIGNAPIVLYALDAAGVFTLCDGSALHAIGYNPDTVVGQSIFAVYRAYPDALDVDAVRRALAGEPSSFVSRVNQVFENHLVPVRDGQGQVTGVIGIAIDITERERAETALRASEERTGAILDATPDATVIVDGDGRIVRVNAQTERLFGYAREELLGRPVELLLPERFRHVHLRHRAGYLAAPRPRRMGEHLDLYARRKDGSEVPAEISLSPLETAEGTLVISTIHDVTARMQAEQALEQSNQDLERANAELARASRVKSEFLATMSHEIRTPMNGVIGMTGLLLDTPLTPEQRAYAETVRSSGEALLTIINDILDFSKIEAGQLTLEVTDLDVQRSVEDVVDLFAAQARDKGLELTSLVHHDVPSMLRGDPGRLRQVLTNLVANALKFTVQGDVVVRASLLEEQDQAVVVRFAVTDTGIGITPEDRTQLFQPFSQADSSTTRKYGGTGLGLAISKRLVELMGGQIGVESESGQGSTFWFSVPLGRSTTTCQADPAAADLHGKRVLVVDDNETSRQIVHYQLLSWGMLNGMAADAQSALAALRDAQQGGTPYDVAILDMAMPGMDGLELARAIKADPALAPIKLVMLASIGLRERGDDEAAWSAPIDAFLTKPVRQSQLYNSLMRVLTGSGDRRPIAAGERDSGAAVPSPVAQRLSLAGRGRVLVVEDNAVNQRVAVRMLETRGYHADAVGNGREALDALAHIPYDLVLMDCQMPEMDGYATTAEIRRREQEQGMTARRTPIVAMTAHALEGDAEKCLAAGMDDYLPKPVTVQHLETVLTRWRPQTAPGAPDEAVDASALAALRDLHGDDGPDLLAGLLAVYLRDTPPCLAALHEAVARADAEALRRAAHSLKGSSSQIGAVQVARLCADLEEQASTTALRGAAETLRRLDDAFGRVRAHLQALAGGGNE